MMLLETILSEFSGTARSMLLDLSCHGKLFGSVLFSDTYSDIDVVVDSELLVAKLLHEGRNLEKRIHPVFAEPALFARFHELMSWRQYCKTVRLDGLVETADFFISSRSELPVFNPQSVVFFNKPDLIRKSGCKLRYQQQTR